MDTAQWPQDIVVKAMEEIVVPSSTCSKPNNSLERKIRPQKEQALNCPRCNSTNTKFCYYNNYSLSQPRYFCKTCRRYWTEGGSLRNIPVGGGSRKNKRSSASSNSSVSSKKLPDLVLPPSISSQQNPKNIPDGQDLNLGFSATHHDFKTISELIQVPNFDTNNNNNDNMPCSSSSTSSHLSALELIGITPTGLSSFLPMPITSHDTVFSSAGFPLPGFKPSLNFSLDGLGSSSGGGYGGSQETSGRLLFPFEDLKQVSGTTTNADSEQNRDHINAASASYWNGVLGGGGGGGGGGSW